MGDKYAECRKSHPDLSGKSDGCQEYIAAWPRDDCRVCGCHRNFHRKVEPPKPLVKYKKVVVYTKCHKIHDLKFQSVDGCQEFTPTGKIGTPLLTCALCGCHKGYHRNEITVEVTSTTRALYNWSMQFAPLSVGSPVLACFFVLLSFFLVIFTLAAKRFSNPWERLLF